jgi:hypothetical protein
MRNDIAYLSNQIEKYPDATLMNGDFWYTITMLRQKAFKNRNGSAEKALKSLCKVIQGDGRAKNTQEDLNELEILIKNDIEFFKEIIERQAHEVISTSKAIDGFLTRDVETIEVRERRIKEKKNYEKVFKAYSEVYNELLSELTPKEIFYFLEQAAEHLIYPNATVKVVPDGRPLMFVKQKTWFVRGGDIKETSDDNA